MDDNWGDAKFELPLNVIESPREAPDVFRAGQKVVLALAPYQPRFLTEMGHCLAEGIDRPEPEIERLHRQLACRSNSLRNRGIADGAL